MERGHSARQSWSAAEVIARMPYEEYRPTPTHSYEAPSTRYPESYTFTPGYSREEKSINSNAWSEHPQQYGGNLPPPLSAAVAVAASASSSAVLPNFFVPPQSSKSTTTTSTTAASSQPMSYSYDSSRRRSLGAVTESVQYQQRHSRSPLHRHAHSSHAMPPPSPPPQHNSSIAHGPLDTSPFASMRDLATHSSNRRSGAGMSISSILGTSVDERKPAHSSSMRPPSPGRARASSMREQYTNGFERSPQQNHMMAEPRSASAAVDPGRSELERVRDTRYDTQRDSINGFRAYRPQDGTNGYGIPGRPSSQPTEYTVAEHPNNASKLGVFRSFASNADSRASEHAWTSSQNVDRSAFSSPGANKETGDVFSPAYAAKQFAAATNEEQIPLFRPSYPATTIPESIEHKSTQDMNTQHMRFRNYNERPLTFEEHQRMEAARALQRKDSDPRSLFNISPELRRRGRDSPLPQAVQGAQPRHIGPGGDHPSIKSEFGRMFSGLGSGVGSATPVAGQSMNGNGTPSRILSPTRPGERGDFERTSFDEDELRKRRNGTRRSREEPDYDGRMTPTLSQSNKRAKTVHPLHHHHHHHHHAHHHHHESAEPAGYSMLRFPSNSATQTPPLHRHHHHHAAHVHHHRHATHSSVPPMKKPSIAIHNNAVLDSVMNKPRKHLGSMPYKAAVSRQHTSRSQHINDCAPDLIPRFDGRENCLYTIRVPRWYVSRNKAEVEARDVDRLEGICRSRRIWGSDIYTDDSDVLAASVHSGWIRGSFSSESLDSIDHEDTPPDEAPRELHLDAVPSNPVDVPAGYDLHITILILPTLQQYTSTHRHHIWSREWIGPEPHDGMSFMIHRIEFIDEGVADRGIGRDARSRKARIAMEEQKRREAAAALLMLPGTNPGISNVVSVGA